MKKLEDLFSCEENQLLEEENKEENLSDRLLIAGFSVPQTMMSVRRTGIIRKIFANYLEGDE